MSLLWAVEQGLQRTSKRMARELGLTGPQRVALRLVGRFPGISPGQLAGLLRLHPSTLTGVLRRLERRRVHLLVRPHGRQLNRRSAGTVEDAVKTLLARVGDRRLHTARQVLTQLADILTAHVDEP
jgi:DNA-binding MarR family transcriptional regulator